jgi:hypothetical protein
MKYVCILNITESGVEGNFEVVADLKALRCDRNLCIEIFY